MQSLIPRSPQIFHKDHLLRAVVALFLTLLLLATPPPASTYAVLAHQAIIDTVWESYLRPALHQKYPKATDQELDAAQAFAYGGSIIQDMGYYPHGSHFFSDLTHYVRSGDFIRALLDNSQDVYDYAFALGALSHYATDNDGHRIATNRAVPILYPNLKKKFGDTVTYEDDPLAHVGTEFGFDVLQVAQGRYAPAKYHNFIGFEVSGRLLETAFRQTYGLELKDVLQDEDKVLNSYRHDVSQLIPKATRIAWSLKGTQIQADQPGITQKKFLYNLSRADYEKEWGKDYLKPSAMEKFLAFLLKLVPKIGPLRVLQLKTPTPETEKLFESSFNASVTGYQKLLAAERQGHLELPNTNFDVGSESLRGKYKLNDSAHVKLLRQLATQKFQGVSPLLRTELLTFFSESMPTSMNAKPAHDTSKEEKARAQIATDLDELRQATLIETSQKPDTPSTAGKEATH
jgi:hypothetical protein